MGVDVGCGTDFIRADVTMRALGTGDAALVEVVDRAAAQMASFAASIAALPGPSAIVSVGPPLFCKGPSTGSLLMPGQVVSG